MIRSSWTSESWSIASGPLRCQRCPNRSDAHYVADLRCGDEAARDDGGDVAGKEQAEFEARPSALQSVGGTHGMLLPVSAARFCLRRRRAMRASSLETSTRPRDPDALDEILARAENVAHDRAEHVEERELPRVSGEAQPKASSRDR